MKSIVAILGTIISGIIGYAMFQATGLCDACNSELFKYVFGIVIVSLFGFIFLIGYMKRRPDW